MELVVGNRKWLHSAVCDVCWHSLSRYSGEGGSRGTEDRLAHRPVVSPLLAHTRRLRLPNCTAPGLAILFVPPPAKPRHTAKPRHDREVYPHSNLMIKNKKKKYRRFFS